MKKSDLLEILEKYSLSPQKKFGQNFLIDDAALDRIVSASAVSNGDSVLEIGPGLGFLTEKLSHAAAKVTAIEIDSGMVRYLNDYFSDNKKVKIIHGDILKIHEPGNYDHIVSNLPYYCSSEILFHLASSSAHKSLTAMLQKEMAERIQAHPESDNYGAISVTLKLYYSAEILFNVDRRSFFPVPDVDSVVIKLTRKECPLDEEGKKIFHSLVKSVFWGRRKTVVKSLTDSPHISYSKDEVKSVLEKTGINEITRGETLSIDDFVLMTEMFRKKEI